MKGTPPWTPSKTWKRENGGWKRWSPIACQNDL